MKLDIWVQMIDDENMMVTIVILAISSVLAAGILFKHQRTLTLLACAGTFWEAQWLVLVLIKRTIGQAINPETFFLAGALVCLVPWLLIFKQWSWPYHKAGSGRRDAAVVFVLAGVLLASWLVQSRNGFQNSAWVTHGFYNGDTMTMVTLVQRSLLEEGLVSGNPFAANEYLEYPSLWHAGLATLIKAFGWGMDWMHFLPTLTYLQIIITIPMFFLLMDTWWPEPEKKEVWWLGIRSRVGVLIIQAAIIGYALAVSWDSYIYPQTHFFIMGLWLLVLTLLVEAEREEGPQRVRLYVTAGVLVLLLMLTNAVTGAAAVAVTIVYYLQKSLTAKQTRGRRGLWLAGIIVWFVLFANFSAGDAGLGWPHFSYTAAESLMRLAPVVIILALIILNQRGTSSGAELTMATLMGMATLMFLTSQRDIVVANGERFIYHALMVGYPSLLPSAINLFYKWRRLWYVSAPPITRLAQVGASVGIITIFLLPALISGARAHDHLMRQDEQRIDLPAQEALEYIRQNTKATDVILAASEAPWMVPMFTGRAMLRADYWLAPEDNMLENVKQAYQGNRAAQVKALQAAQYLLIRQEEIVKWELESYEKVFHNGDLAIYKTSGSGAKTN